MTSFRLWFAAASIIFSTVVATAQDFGALVPGAAASGAAPAPPPISRPVAPSHPQQRPTERAATPHGPQVGAVTPPPAGQSGPITVRTSISRTAVWVGEPIVYTVDVTCPPGSDIMAADLARDRLRPSGLDVIDAVDTHTVDEDGTKHYRTEFRLVSFLIDGSAVGLEPQPIRYFVHTAGQAPDTLVPADEIRLSPVSIAVRSTLPDATVTWIRDTRATRSMPSVLGYLAPAGWALIACALVPLALAGVGLARRKAPQRAARRQRSTPALRARIAELRALDLGNEESRQQAFAAANEIIRARLDDMDIPAPALTIAELEPLIKERAGTDGTDVRAVLRACEEALYGGPAHLPPRSAATVAIDCAEQLLSAKAR